MIDSVVRIIADEAAGVVFVLVLTAYVWLFSWYFRAMSRSIKNTWLNSERKD